MKKSKMHDFRWQRKAFAVAVASCFAITPAYAIPTGASIVNGQVNISQRGGVLSITNSPGAIINWQGFSIGANELTRFFQQSASSSVLNRVVGQDPSSILGALQSNGRVFLINPNGVLFGQGAVVNVAGLVTSTLNLSDADFLAGKLNFSAVPGAGSVVNQGNITTPTGGRVYLVAPNVTNSGFITSPQGEIILAAGNSVELVDSGTPDVHVVMTAPDGQAMNIGQIVAHSGRVGIYAGLIHQRGAVHADTAVVGKHGQIIFKASKDITLASGSTVSANGPQGGEIKIQSGVITLASGKIEAKGSAGQGGSVQLLGNLVGLINGANIDASGRNGGGTVLVGGDAHGANPGVPNAKAVFVDAATEIKADALKSGNGGKVVVWSNDSTKFYGAIKARGGLQSGNGGFVETSGHYLDVAGATVNASAPNGSTGTWLLDPYNVTIDGATTSSMSGAWSAANPNVWVPSATGSTILVTDIAANLANADVTITTTNATVGEAGDITWNANATLDYNGIGTLNNRTLALQADHNIIFNGKIWDSTLSTADLLNVVFDSNATGGASGGNIQMNTGSSIVTNGGNITFGGGVNPLITAALGSGTASSADASGIYLDAATLDAGAGNISLMGAGVAGTNCLTSGGVCGVGIYATNGSLIQTTSGTITLDGTGGAGTNWNAGVRLGTNMQITSANGAISITGGGAGTGTNNYGVYVHNGAKVTSTATSTITLDGTGGAGSTDNYGVYISAFGGPTALTSVNGLISITGQGGAGTGSWNIGVYVHDNAAIASTGAATLTLNGTGGAGTTDNYGVRLSSGMQITSANGDVSIIGQGAGTGAGNYGIIHTNTSGAIASTGLANITLDGRGAGGAAGINTAGAIQGSPSTGNVTLIADTATGVDSILLSGTVSGTGNLLLQPLNPATTIGIADGAGTYNLSTAELNTFLPGFASLTFGRANGTGLITFGNGGAGYTFNANTVIQNPGLLTNGGITITDPISTGLNSLTLNSGGNLNVNGSVNAGIFTLSGGTWSQVSATLPSFTVNDFRITGGTFIRALGGNGIDLPYQLTDIYGVQGMGSAGMLGYAFALANNVDATGTANWNAGAGFMPVGNATTAFTGTFDGQNHTISNLFINLPTTPDVGLFGYTDTGSAIRNVGLVGGSVTGDMSVGGLVGNNGGTWGGLATVSNSYSSGITVNGYSSVGGLVGDNYGSISNSYSSGGTVNGSFGFGGLVGGNWDAINTSYSTNAVAVGGGGLTGWDEMGFLNNSYWDIQTSGRALSGGAETGLTSAQMVTMASFAGWNIANTGGAGAIWRIYEGSTAPLLTSFLTPLTVTANAATKTFDGLPYSGGNGVTYSNVDAVLFGTVAYGGTSQGAVNGGNYAIAASGLYSDQQGYDISYADGVLIITQAPPPPVTPPPVMPPPVTPPPVTPPPVTPPPVTPPPVTPPPVTPPPVTPPPVTPPPGALQPDPSLLNPSIDATNGIDGEAPNLANQEANFINVLTSANPPGAGGEGDLPPWLRKRNLGSCTWSST